MPLSGKKAPGREAGQFKACLECSSNREEADIIGSGWRREREVDVGGPRGQEPGGLCRPLKTGFYWTGLENCCRGISRAMTQISLTL